MNEQFYELPSEKQLRIINAGLEVFSQNEYKRAVTDEIAHKAGISKGLLFYYFHNKKSLYAFLCKYSIDLVLGQVMDEAFRRLTDFFELIDYAAEKKIRLFDKSPYLADFMVRSFYAPVPDGAASEGFLTDQRKEQYDVFDNYFAQVDFSKFKENVNPREVYDMLTWMTEGFIYEKRKRGETLGMEMLMEVFRRWETWLRQIAYKEEYQ